MDPPALVLLLLAAFQAWPPASAQRRLGCLFHDELCSSYEICVNDGMFGRCGRPPLTEISTYDVSPAAAQRFRLLLEKLSSRGLTWGDAATQQALSRELSHLTRTPSGPPDPRPVYPPAGGREELNRNREAYLQRLAPPPWTPSPQAPRPAPRQGEHHRSGGQRSASVQSSRPRGPQGEGELLGAALQVYLGPPGPPRQALPPGGPLSPLDERFIQKVLRGMVGEEEEERVGEEEEDLDQLLALIADALQAVDRDRPEPRDLEQEEQERREEGRMREGGEEEGEEASSVKTLESPMQEAALREHAVEVDQPITGEKSQQGALFSKLLEYLDFRATPDPRPLPPPAGGENIRSRSQRVKVQKKDITRSEVEAEEVSEVEGWVREVLPPPAALLRPPRPPGPPPRQAGAPPDPELQLDVSQTPAGTDLFGYVITDTDGLQTDEGVQLMRVLAHMANIQMTDVADLSVVGPAVTFKVHPNRRNISTADVADVAVQQRAALEKEAKVTILEAGTAESSQINQIPTKFSQAESTKFLVLTVVSLLCIAAVLLASSVVYCLRHRSHHALKQKLSSLGSDAPGEATSTYQELCRQRMAGKPPPDRPEPLSSRINSVSSQFSDGGGAAAVSPSARSSTSSWCEEPAHSNMDISTGHMILAYMEDHLKNKNRLQKEWEALCSYTAEPNATVAGLRDANAKKNRSSAVVAYDHSRIALKVENSQGNSDYINASPIMDHDPRSPAYIATQGPLPSTVADFWQMVWENGCVVMVMLTPLVEGGVKQCYHYWPDEGSNLYHIYEVNLVSEHIWCDDFLVRSFYLKNLQTNETRTVTQFHFLTWSAAAAPQSCRPLLDLRRKVNRCYRGRSCPIIVHCSDGAGRTGTYILIDMVLNKMAKGAKEIDIAATLEHLRDQRPGMVQSKEQFEFVLTAVAEEVNVILKALPQ